MLARILAFLGSNMIIRLFRGIAGPILDHYKSKDIQTTKRQGIWATALIGAANADVENRRLAMQERANSPLLMWIYVMVLIGPVLYYLLFWFDTIFANQIWEIDLWLFTIPIWDWQEYELQRAPERLEDMGRWVIGIFLGATGAVTGIVKGAKALRAAGIFKGK